MNPKNPGRLVLLTVIFALVLFVLPPVPKAAAESTLATFPEPPLLMYPRKNAALNDIRPYFVWEHVEGATKYTLEIKDRYTNAVITKTTYSAAVRCSCGVCGVNSPVDLVNGDYKWHVLSRTDTQKGEWSLWWNLTIGPISLSAPTLVAPADNTIIYTNQPRLVWMPSAGAIDYRIRIKDITGYFVVDIVVPCSVCHGNPGDTCVYTPAIHPAVNHGVYRWQVQGINGSNYSTWTTFWRLRYTAIPRSTHLAPADGTTVGAYPTFRWREVTGADEYQLQIRRVSDDAIVFNQLVGNKFCNGTTCEYTINQSLPNAQYRWHVRGKSGDNLAQWTAYWYFFLTN